MDGRGRIHAALVANNVFAQVAQDNITLCTSRLTLLNRDDGLIEHCTVLSAHYGIVTG